MDGRPENITLPPPVVGEGIMTKIKIEIMFLTHEL